MSSKFLTPASSQVEISDVVGLQDELDDIEAQIAGGGGGGDLSFDSGSVVQGNGIVFRNGTDTDKLKNASSFALVNLIGIGDSLSVNNIQLPSIYNVEQEINANSTKLTQVTYDGATQITKIDGELDVDKIKNTAGTAEVELETNGNINIDADGAIITTTPQTLQQYGGNIGLLSTTSILLSATTTNTIASNGKLILQSVNDNIENKTNNLITFEDLGASNGVMEINPATQTINFKKNNSLYGLVGLNSVTNDLMITASNALKLTTLYGDITLNSGGLLTTTNAPTTDSCIMNRIYTREEINFAIKDLPVVTTFRLPKNPQRPVLTDPVYEDEVLKLGWDNPTGNDLEVAFKTGSDDYNSYCYKPGTSSSIRRTITSKNTKVDLNNFAFTGGEIMIADLVTIGSQVFGPRYLITLFWTEDSLGIDGDIVFRIEKFNNQDQS
tara:strand:- start:272 stop:1594 length:1323 start_codon:yes stop_codon:yes gene_type:complete